jgi:hypothetical protein
MVENQFGKHLTIILKELCNWVSADYESMNFKEDNWYMKYEWELEKEKSFKKWLADYFYNSQEARREMLTFPRKNKKRCSDSADWFVFQYGWKIKRD